MLRTILATLVFSAVAGVGFAQDGPFRLVDVNEDGVLAIAEASIRTDEQGFRTFRFASVLTDADVIELDGREFSSTAMTGSATMDCSSGHVRLDRLNYLDLNFAVVGAAPSNSGFEDPEAPNLRRTICSSTSADIAALSPPYDNVRSISLIAHNYTGAGSRNDPRMLWSTLPLEGDRVTCLARAYAAFQELGYSADRPEPGWVGVHGVHPTLPIGSLIRCSAPGEFVIFVSRPSFGLGDLDHEVGKIEAALRND